MFIPTSSASASPASNAPTFDMIAMSLSWGRVIEAGQMAVTPREAS